MTVGRAQEHGDTLLPASRERLVVVGFGIAAYRFIERLGQLGALDRYDVTVLGEEPHPAYNRVRLTEWLGHRDPTKLALGSSDWGRDRRIRIETGSAVVSIDRKTRAVETACGKRVAYDRLVLATGSYPFVPRIEGVRAEGVFVYRTLGDLERIRAHATESRRAVVVGGGLLGIELAEGLRCLGLHVVVLERTSHLLSRQFAPDAGTLLETRIRRAGIQPILAADLRRIEARDTTLALTIGGLDMPLVTDMVVIAAGVRPRDELARESGINVAYRSGGIVVNDRLRSSDPSVYAIGECASLRGVVLGQAGPSYRMAGTLAEIMAGRRSFHGRHTPASRLRLLDIDIWSVGDATVVGERVTWRRNGRYRQITLRAGQVISGTSIGPWDELSVVQDLIHRRRPVWWWQLRRFRSEGRLLPGSAAVSVADWPPSRVVCNCVGVTRADLDAAKWQGCASVEAVARRTRASTVCGSCRPLLAELMGEESSGSTDGAPPAQIAAAVIVLFLAFGIALAPPIPPAASLSESGLGDTLHRDAGWKQISGFALLGCTLATLALSLRKRWRLIRFATMRFWRVTHAAIAGLALIAFVTHTGLRLGSGLNRALAVSFLCAAVFGAAAALGWGRRAAGAMFWLHVLAVWPLPVLLFFHILSTYYF